MHSLTGTRALQGLPDGSWSPLAQPRGLSPWSVRSRAPLRWGKWLETRLLTSARAGNQPRVSPQSERCHTATPLVPVQIPKVPEWEWMSKGGDEWVRGWQDTVGVGERLGCPVPPKITWLSPPPPPPQAVKIKGPHSGLALYSLIWAGFVLLNVGSGLRGTSLSRLSPSLAAH